MMGLAEQHVEQRVNVEQPVKLHVIDSEPIPVEEQEPVVVPFLVDAVSRIKQGAKWRLEVIGEWIGDGTSFVVKGLREGTGAFWGAVWKGQVFPLRMEIVDFETGKDELVNVRMFGRLSGLVVVSVINSFVLLTLRHKKFLVAMSVLGVISIFSYYAFVALQLAACFGVLVYLPLGFWKSRTYRGLKALVVEELDRLVDTKKCENSSE